MKMRLKTLTLGFTVLTGLALATAPAIRAQNAQPKALKATRFLVTQKIELLNSQGNTFRLEPGFIPLVVGDFTPLAVDEFITPLDTAETFRGGDGEPPRGPVHVSFRNDFSQKRGILELRFENQSALFWLDAVIDVNPETGTPQVPQLVRASAGRSGQKLAVKLIVNRQAPNLAPLTLVLLESNSKIVADIELE